jgi:hypothetical protein
MKRILVRYKVKADKAADNEAFIRAVFEQLAEQQPEKLRYASFKLEDGLSFVHIAELADEGGANPLAALPAFKAFVADIKDRCDEPPVAMAMAEVGNYRLF